MFDPDFCELRCPICTRARNGNRIARMFQAIEMAVTSGDAHRSSETEEVRRAAQRACVLDTTGAGIRRS